MQLGIHQCADQPDRRRRTTQATQPCRASEPPMTAAYELPEVPQDERARRAERMRIRFVPPEDFDWIEKRTGLRLSSAARGVEAVNARGEIRGMIMFDMGAPNSAQAHM